MNIYEKMSAVTEKIARVPKNLTVGTGKNQYKAVAEGDILAAVKDAERECGIFSYPSQHKVIESRTFTTKNDYGEKENQFVRVEATYRFVDMEKPEDFVEVTGYGDGVDSLDKAPGKAITYADKYALMKAYKVETGDDTDRTPSDELAGHDILKIKQRVEHTLTEKMQHGMDVKDIYASIGISERQFKTMLDMYAKLNNFELAVKKS